jgi:hypothetical protein
MSTGFDSLFLIPLFPLKDHRSHCRSLLQSHKLPHLHTHAMQRWSGCVVAHRPLGTELPVSAHLALPLNFHRLDAVGPGSEEDSLEGFVQIQ